MVVYVHYAAGAFGVTSDKMHQQQPMLGFCVGHVLHCTPITDQVSNICWHHPALLQVHTRFSANIKQQRSHEKIRPKQPGHQQGAAVPLGPACYIHKYCHACRHTTVCVGHLMATQRCSPSPNSAWIIRTCDAVPHCSPSLHSVTLITDMWPARHKLLSTHFALPTTILLVGDGRGRVCT
jgi:hypothetical protein